jgi:ribose transport system permease protein
MSIARDSSVSSLLSEYGMLLVLAGLCVVFSALTWSEQMPEGGDAGQRLAEEVNERFQSVPRVLLLGQKTDVDREFAAAFRDTLNLENATLTTVLGDPREIRKELVELEAAGYLQGVIGISAGLKSWPLITSLREDFPGLRGLEVVSPRPYGWPTFLKADNLLNISNQIAEIAIVAVGMTVVIIAGGIDLSVGSLIALAAMTSCLLIQEVGGGREAGVMAMTLSSLAGMGVCGAMGLFTGLVVTLFRVPPFVVTLGVMLAASGFAGMLTGGEAAHRVPESYTAFASGTPLGIPNAIVLMLALYALFHVVMGRTVWGRHVYAIGGNRLAAHLSGIPTHRLILSTYVLSALMAGLAGIVMASRLKSGNPTFGKTYELSVIAAVVVGGTSLSGGSGKILGTLIGAFIIAVMQNGMNLLNGMRIVRIDDFAQNVVLGCVLLAAVVLDQLKRRGFHGWRQAP